MNRQEIIEMLASWFGIDPDENGEYDIESYYWQAGCSMGFGGKWLSLAEVVKCIESSM